MVDVKAILANAINITFANDYPNDKQQLIVTLKSMVISNVTYVRPGFMLIQLSYSPLLQFLNSIVHVF